MKNKYLFLLFVMFVPLCGIAFQTGLEVRVGELENRVGTIEGYLLLNPTQEVVITPTVISTIDPSTPTPEICFVYAQVNITSKLNVRTSPGGQYARQLYPNEKIYYFQEETYPTALGFQWVQLATSGWVAKTYLKDLSFTCN